MTKPYRIGVLNDTHIPYHDPRSLDLVLDIFQDLQIEKLVINGDWLDAYNLSMHGPKSPEVITTLEEEFLQGYNLLKKVRDTLPDSEILYIFGNHEDRLNRFITNNAKAFWGLVTIENQLRLSDFDIDWMPYNSAYNVPKTKLFIQHSPPSYGENGARTSLLKKPNASFIYGCTHRMQHASITDTHKEVHSVHFNGWLGSTSLSREHEVVFSYAKGHQNWQQCFAIVTVDGPRHFVQQVEIKDYTAVVDGFLYQG